MTHYTLINNGITVRHETYPSGVKPAGPHAIGHHELGKYWDGSAAVDKPLELLQADLKAENLQHRLNRMADGINYVFPDGAGTVQTRNNTDLGNINAAATTAIVLQGQAVTDPVIKFRDTENTTHLMTPAQAIAFGVALSAAITAIYQTKWDIDEAIDALATTEAALAYNVAAQWAGA